MNHIDSVARPVPSKPSKLAPRTSESVELTLLELSDPGIPGVESYSPFCLKVHRALKLKNLSYQRVLGSRPAEHKKHNPTGQVPVLLVSGVAVSDSTAILRRIEELAGPFAPSLDACGRAEAELFEELGDATLNGFLVAARWADEENWVRYEKAIFGGAPAPVRWIIAPRTRRHVVSNLIARDVWRRGPDACWKRFAEVLDALEVRAPREGFWVGSEVSLGDLGLFAQLHSLRTDVTPAQCKMVEDRPRLLAYLSRVDRATSLVS